MPQNKRAFGVLDCNGAMAEYVAIPARLLFKLADQVSYDVGSMMEPLAVSCRAVNHADDLAGKSVIIVGAGTIGLLALALVKMRGPAKIFVSDLSDSRLEVAKRMGADITVNPARDDLGVIVKEQTDGRNLDVAFEAVGATPTVQQAMACLKFGGTAVWIGNSAKMITINMQEIVTRELKVRGTFLYSKKEFGEVAQMLNSGQAVRRTNDQLEGSDDGSGDRAVRQIGQGPRSAHQGDPQQLGGNEQTRSVQRVFAGNRGRTDPSPERHRGHRENGDQEGPLDCSNTGIALEIHM